MAQALANPAVLVTREPSAQVFGTAALAAAAMADASPAEPVPAASIEHTIAPALALQQAESTLQSVGTRTKPGALTRTLLMGSVTRTESPAQAAPPALSRGNCFGRRSRMALVAVLASLLIAAGIAVFSGTSSPGSVYAETQAPPNAAGKPSAERSLATPARSVRETSAVQPNPRSAAGRGKAKGPKWKNGGQRSTTSQELVNEGYARMQRGDFAGAEASFSEALELDPANDSARKGLQAARTAQTVQGVAHVLGR